MAFSTPAKLQHLDGGVQKTLPAATGAIDADQIRVNEVHLNAGGLAFRNTADNADVFSVSNEGVLTSASAMNVTGDLTVAGNAYVQGARFQVDSTIQLERDNLIVVGSAPTALSDGGVLVERFHTAWGVADVTGTAQANAGSLATIKIAADDAAAVNDYAGYAIAITGGTGNGQQRQVVSNDAGKLLTPDRPWTVAPDATSTYSLFLLADRYAGMVWDESAGAFRFGKTGIDPGTGNVSFESNLDAILATLTASDVQTGTMTASGAVGVSSLTVGGGYGSTGVSVSAAGAIQANGGLTVDGSSVLGVLGASGQVDFSANVDASLGLDIDADNQSLTIGAGADLSFSHDGTNSTVTSTTGDLNIVSTAAAGAVIVKLGTTDINTRFSVAGSNSGNLFQVSGTGNVTLKGNASISASNSMSVGGGAGSAYLVLTANAAEVARVVGPGGGQQAFLPSADSTVNLGADNNAFKTAWIDTVTTLTANDRVKLGTNAEVLLGLPSFTSAQITANIAAPAAGDFLFDSDTTSVKYYSGAGWVSLSSSTAPTLDAAYNGGSSITVDAGPVALVQSLTSEDVGTLNITYAASAFTGQSSGIKVDLSNATSFNNASDFYGVRLTGATNAGAGNSVGLRISAFDVGIENTGTLSQSGVSTFTGNVGQTTGTFTYNVAASAFSVDAVSFSVDSTSASNVAVTGGNLSLQTLSSGTLILSSAGAATYDAASSVTIGGTNATSLDLGRSGQMTTVKGTLNVDEAVTFDSTLEVTGQLNASEDVVVAQGKSIASSGWTTAGCATGEVVYASAASTVTIADADDISASKIIGVVNDAGEVVHVGPCSFHLDAAGCSAGDRLYASPTAGRVTTTAPGTATQYVAPVGIALAVIAANATGRGIFMREPAILLS